MNKTVNSNSKELLPITDSIVTCDLNTTGRIVCVNAICEVKSTEESVRELRVNLITSFRVITIDDDGEYDVSVARAESVAIMTGEYIEPGTKAVIRGDVTDCTYSDREGGKATAHIRLEGWYLKINELSFLDEDRPEVYCRSAKYDVENVACVDTTTVNVTATHEARLPIKKVLDCSAKIVLNNIYPSQGSFQLEGDVITRLITLSDNGVFVTQSFSSPFSSEIVADCCTVDSVIDLYPDVVRTEITITESDERVFVADSDLRFTYAVGEKQVIDGITDCYSTKYELVTENATSVLNTCSCFRSVRDKVSGAVKTDSVIEELLCAAAPYVSDLSISSSDGLGINGLVTATIVFADENGIKTQRCEMPFSTTVASEFDCRDSFLPEVKIIGLSARVRNANEIEVTAELYASIRGTNSHEINLISDIEAVGEKPEAEYAISLYIVKPGEDVWDVAKALCTDEDKIFRLNPELSLPLKGGEKVIVYNELIFEV